MKEDIKKTAKAHGTVSVEKALKKAEKVKEVTEELLDAVEEIESIDEIVEEKVEKKVPQRRGRYEPTTEEIVLAWEPKTKLGKDVKSGKIKSIDEILDNDQKILESEIVDKLISPKVDLIAQGQAKGKFGGGKRRAWRQTQRITQEGGVLTFSAMAVAGDENGHVGIGVGKSGETLPARDKATRKAKLSVIKVSRGCAAFDCNCSEKHTVPFVVKGKSGSVTVELIPAPQGTGLVCARELQKILKMAGIKDVYSKTSGKVRTTFNLAKACIEALKETNRK
ncbi:30S ribosomal protein S5 [archaeon]|nr:30S ribosomal protein S5 [archaeon]